MPPLPTLSSLTAKSFNPAFLQPYREDTPPPENESHHEAVRGIHYCEQQYPNHAAFCRSPDFQVYKAQVREQLNYLASFCEQETMLSAPQIREGFNRFFSLRFDTPDYFSTLVNRVDGEGKRKLDEFCALVRDPRIDLELKKATIHNLSQGIVVCAPGILMHLGEATEELFISIGGIKGKLWQVKKEIVKNVITNAVRNQYEHAPNYIGNEIHYFNAVWNYLAFESNQDFKFGLTPEVDEFVEPHIPPDFCNKCGELIHNALTPLAIARKIAEECLEKFRDKMQSSPGDLLDHIKTIRHGLKLSEASFPATNFVDSDSGEIRPSAKWIIPDILAEIDKLGLLAVQPHQLAGWQENTPLYFTETFVRICSLGDLIWQSSCQIEGPAAPPDGVFENESGPNDARPNADENRDPQEINVPNADLASLRKPAWGPNVVVERPISLDLLAEYEKTGKTWLQQLMLENDARAIQEIHQRWGSVESINTAALQGRGPVPMLYETMTRNHQAAIQVWRTLLAQAILKEEVQQNLVALLAAKDETGTPGLYAALQQGNADAIEAYGNLLKDPDIIHYIKPTFLVELYIKPALLKELLAAKAQDGTSGLYMALQEGKEEAIEAFGAILTDANVLPHIKSWLPELLAAKNQDNTPGLYAALDQGHAKAIKAYTAILTHINIFPQIKPSLLANIYITTSELLTLVTAKAQDGTPGLHRALEHGYAETIQAYHALLTNPNVLPHIKSWLPQLLIAKNNVETPGLYAALSHGHTAAIQAYHALLTDPNILPHIKSWLPQLLMAKDKAGTPGLYPVLHHGHTEAIEAYHALLQDPRILPHIKSKLPQLLMAKNKGGTPGLYLALYRNNLATLRAYSKMVKALFTETSVFKYFKSSGLEKFFNQSLFTLEIALRQGTAAALNAYGALLRNKKLIQPVKPPFLKDLYFQPAVLKELLIARDQEGRPGLYAALYENTVDTVREYHRLLNAPYILPYTKPWLKELLAAKDQAGTPGLYAALQQNSADAIQFYGLILKDPTVLPQIKSSWLSTLRITTSVLVELLMAKAQDGTPGLYRALYEGSANAIHAYHMLLKDPLIFPLIQSRLLRLLIAENKAETPALYAALQQSRFEAIDAYGKFVKDPVIFPKIQSKLPKLFMAKDKAGRPGLYVALQQGSGKTIDAYSRLLQALLEDEKSLKYFTSSWLKTFVLAKDKEKVSGLLMALCQNNAEAIRVYTSMLKAPCFRKHIDTILLDLVTTKDKFGTSGLYIALEQGNAEAIEAYGTLLKTASVIAPQIKAKFATLLAAKHQDGTGGLFAALAGKHDMANGAAIRAYGAILSDPSVVAHIPSTMLIELLLVKKEGVFGLHYALRKRNVETIRSYGSLLKKFFIQPPIDALVLQALEVEKNSLFGLSVALKEKNFELVNAYFSILKDFNIRENAPLMKEEMSSIVTRVVKKRHNNMTLYQALVTGNVKAINDYGFLLKNPGTLNRINPSLLTTLLKGGEGDTSGLGMAIATGHHDAIQAYGSILKDPNVFNHLGPLNVVELLTAKVKMTRGDIQSGLSLALQSNNCVQCIDAYGTILQDDPLLEYIGALHLGTLLEAKDQTGTTGLYTALNENKISVIEAYVRLLTAPILLTRIQPSPLRRMLSAKSADHKPGLHVALEKGYDQAIQAYSALFSHSFILERLTPHDLKELLAAKDSNGVPGLYSALEENQPEGILAYGWLLKALKEDFTTFSQMELWLVHCLVAKNKEGVSGLYAALALGNTEAVIAYGTMLKFLAEDPEILDLIQFWLVELLMDKSEDNIFAPHIPRYDDNTVAFVVYKTLLEEIQQIILNSGSSELIELTLAA